MVKAKKRCVTLMHKDSSQTVGTVNLYTREIAENLREIFFQIGATLELMVEYCDHVTTCSVI